MNWLDWLEKHQALSSWVQAIGAVVAIGVGFAVAVWQQRNVRGDLNHQNQIKGLALAILIRDELATLCGKFGALTSADIDDEEPLNVLDFALSAPDLISRYADQMFLLHEAGHSVLKLLATLSSNRAMLENLEEAIDSGKTDYDERFSDFISIAGRGLAAAEKALQGIDDYIKREKSEV